jgi:hypothetical protein
LEETCVVFEQNSFPWRLFISFFPYKFDPIFCMGIFEK